MDRLPGLAIEDHRQVHPHPEFIEREHGRTGQNLVLSEPGPNTVRPKTPSLRISQ